MRVMSRSKGMAAYCGRGGICFLTTHPVRANWNLSGIFKLLKFSVFPASLIFVCYVQFTEKKNYEWSWFNNTIHIQLSLNK